MEELIKEMVTAIQAGTMKSEDAVMIISRRTKKPEPMVRARLAVVLRLANNFKDIKSSRQSSIPTSSAAAPGSLKPHAGGTVAPDDFMAVMKEHGLNKKQAAEAIGRSVSRVHELTTTKGGSPALLELFKQKLSEYKPN